MMIYIPFPFQKQTAALFLFICRSLHAFSICYFFNANLSFLFPANPCNFGLFQNQTLSDLLQLPHERKEREKKESDDVYQVPAL